MGELKIQDHTGHDQIEWNPENAFDVKRARDRFEKCVKADKTHKAYRTNHVGGKGERIEVFDPNARIITLVAIAVGG